MKWSTRKPEIGERKFVEKYAFFPVHIENSAEDLYVWLETYTQIYVYREDFWSGKSRWVKTDKFYILRKTWNI